MFTWLHILCSRTRAVPILLVLLFALSGCFQSEMVWTTIDGSNGSSSSIEDDSSDDGSDDNSPQPPQGPTLNPPQATVNAKGAMTFVASGGTPPYQYEVLPGNLGGSIDASGVYTAPSRDIWDFFGDGILEVRVTDSKGLSARSLVSARETFRLSSGFVVLTPSTYHWFGSTGGAAPLSYTSLLGVFDSYGNFTSANTPALDIITLTDGGGRSRSLDVITVPTIAQHCTDTFRAEAAGVLHDSGGDGNTYGSSQTCGIVIQPAGGASSITLEAIQIYVDGDEYVRIYDGVDATGTPLHSGSGFSYTYTDLPTVVATSGSMYIEFTSNASTYYYHNYSFRWRSSPSGAPVASFSPSIAAPMVGESVTFVDTSLSSPTSWEWDFEDDGVIDSTVQSPVHAFRAPGTKSVVLKVANASGSHLVRAKIVVGEVSLCSIASTAATMGKLLDSGGSASNSTPNQTCGFLIQPSTPVSEILFDVRSLNLNYFEGESLRVYDGTSSAGIPLHTGSGFTGSNLPPAMHARSGAMYIELVSTANPWGGLEAMWLANPVGAPVAEISMPDFVDIGQSVQFTDASSGDPKSWRWKFGSGGSWESELRNPTKAFTAGNEYQIEMVSMNSSGASLSRKKLRVGMYRMCEAGRGSSQASHGRLFDSGGNGADYGPGESCAFLIKPAGTPGVITFNLYSYGIESGVDHLQVYDGENSSGIPLHSGAGFTGHSGAGGLVAYSGAVYVVMTSDGANQAWGFDADWQSTPAGSPSPDFSVSPASAIDAGEAITFTDLSGNSPTSWAWDFNGDGAIDSTARNPVHSYSIPGFYTVRLTASNANGANQRVKQVEVGQHRLCNASSLSSVAPAGDLYDSGGASGSYGPNENCSFLIQPSGSPGQIRLRLHWYSTDGAGPDLIRVYDGIDATGVPLHSGAGFSGSYWSTQDLIAYSGAIFVQMSTDSINEGMGFSSQWTSSAPGSAGARFSASARYVDAGTNVTFTDSSTGSPTAWAWDFESDGTVDDTTSSPTYAFPANGTYEVRFQASNSNGGSEYVERIHVGSYPMCVAGVSGSQGSNGSLFDSGGPSQNYGPNESCSFLIQPTGGTSMIKLSYYLDQVELGVDSLQVYDGVDATGIPLFGAPGTSGYSISGEVRAYSGAMFVVFTSNAVNDLSGFSASWTALASGIPAARFTADDFVSAAESVAFTDASVGGATSWAWDFDSDGNTDSTAQNPNHVFGTAGIYAVRLTASNATGSSYVDQVIRVESAKMCIDSFLDFVASNIYDSGGPSGYYQNSENCGILIQPVGGASTITLAFPEFNTEGSNYDRLQVFDGINDMGVALHMGSGFNGYYGSYGIGAVTATSGSMYIRFISDGVYTYPGFQLRYTSSP